MATAFPSMRRVAVVHGRDVLWLDLWHIDHQPIFLDGGVSSEPLEREAVPRLVDPGRVAIDVGANVGVFATLLADLFGPTGLVLAYEPAATPLLVNATSRPQLLVRPFAVADRGGTVAFRHHRSTTLSRIVPDAERRPGDANLSTVTIDGELQRLGLSRIDFVKIDVEGHEDAVLRGAAGFLAREPRPVLMFEWIPDFRGRSTEGPVGALARLGGTGWRLFRAGWDRPPAPLPGLEEPDSPATIFAFPPERPDRLTAFLEVASLA